MADLGIFQVFKETDCESLTVSCGEVALSKTTTSRVLECMKGKRSRFSLEFAGAYPGDQKRKVGVSVVLQRIKGVRFGMNLAWFLTDEDPPPGLGKVGELFPCVAPTFGEKEVDVSTTFAYGRQKVGSIFRPIQMAEGTTIFDEIVGFSGTKRDPHGKLLYTLEVKLGQKKLKHVVRFRQAVKLVEDLPLFLIPSAKRISALALEKVGA